MSRDPSVTSRIMSAVRNRDTKPELALRRALWRRGLRYRLKTTVHGKPDIVFPGARVAVFVDGDFWHGWRFQEWRDKLSPAWETKIAGNRKRDSRNFRLLRQQGWKVIRLWEHQIERNPKACLRKVTKFIHERTVNFP